MSPAWRSVPAAPGKLPAPYLAMLARLGGRVPLGTRAASELRRPRLFAAGSRLLACLSRPAAQLRLVLLGDDGEGVAVLSPTVHVRFVHVLLVWRATAEEALTAPGSLVWTWERVGGAS